MFPRQGTAVCVDAAGIVTTPSLRASAQPPSCGKRRGAHDDSNDQQFKHSTHSLGQPATRH